MRVWNMIFQDFKIPTGRLNNKSMLNIMACTSQIRKHYLGCRVLKFEEKEFIVPTPDDEPYVFVESYEYENPNNHRKAPDSNIESSQL